MFDFAGVCPSFHLKPVLIGIRSLFFLKFGTVIFSQNSIKLVRMVFLGKLRFAWKWAKRFKNDGFFIFWNILSLVSHGNVLKWKIIYISWQTPYLPRLKSLVLKLKTKILSVNQIAESLNCIISRKKWETKLTFCIKMNITVFYELILSFLVAIARHF